MFYSAAAFFFFSGSPCIGSKRTSLRSYHRRPTSINHCLYDTAPLAFFCYFLRCPLWLRNLKSGWRHGTSYKCFSKPNVSTMPTVSRLLNTRALLWPLRTSNFQKTADRKVHHTLRRLNFDIQWLSLHFSKTIEEFKHSKIEQWTAKSCWHCWLTGRSTAQPPEPLTVLLWRCRSCCSPPSPCRSHLKATPLNNSIPQLFARYIINVSLW